VLAGIALAAAALAGSPSQHAGAATIAANGGTVSVGFNGTDTGQDPPPTVLHINGTACANN